MNNGFYFRCLAVFLAGGTFSGNALGATEAQKQAAFDEIDLLQREKSVPNRLLEALVHSLLNAPTTPNSQVPLARQSRSRSGLAREDFDTASLKLPKGSNLAEQLVAARRLLLSKQDKNNSNAVLRTLEEAVKFSLSQLGIPVASSAVSSGTCLSKPNAPAVAPEGLIRDVRAIGRFAAAMPASAAPNPALTVQNTQLTVVERLRGLNALAQRDGRKEALKIFLSTNLWDTNNQGVTATVTSALSSGALDDVRPAISSFLGYANQWESRFRLEVENEIQGMVSDAKLDQDQERRGRLKRSDMIASDARVHYLDFISDIPEKGQGYYHHTVIQPVLFSSRIASRGLPVSLINESSRNFAHEIQRNIRDGKSVSTFVLGNGSHYVSLAIHENGRVMVVDSMSRLGYLSPVQKRNLVALLNQSGIKNRADQVIRFGSVEEVAATQQKGDANCLILAMLNSHQIAKKADLNAYKEVTASLNSGELRTYEDIGKIGKHGRREKNTYTTNASYRAFMSDFRRRTQDNIDSYAGGEEPPVQVFRASVLPRGGQPAVKRAAEARRVTGAKRVAEAKAEQARQLKLREREAADRRVAEQLHREELRAQEIRMRRAREQREATDRKAALELQRAEQAARQRALRERAEQEAADRRVAEELQRQYDSEEGE